jgi:hypothetical protein
VGTHRKRWLLSGRWQKLCEDCVYSAETKTLTLPKGATVYGTILVYGNESTLVTTRGLILEKAGYRVFTAIEFSAAMIALMNQQIDVLLLCQSLRDEERRGIVETAHAIRPDIRCAVFGYDVHEIELKDTEAFENIDGPSGLLKAIGKLLSKKTPSETTSVSLNG